MIIPVYVSGTLKQRLEHVARLEGESVSGLVRRALEEWLARRGVDVDAQDPLVEVDIEIFDEELERLREVVEKVEMMHGVERIRALREARERWVELRKWVERLPGGGGLERRGKLAELLRRVRHAMAKPVS